MTDVEIFQFMDVFNTLRQVFPIRGDEHDVRERGQAYFKALRRYPLASLSAGADAWIECGKYFPKPAEWIDTIPRATAKAAEVPTLSEGEALEYQRAKRLVWEDEPCTCRDCRAANISTRPIRFVPEFTADDRERTVRNPLSDELVTAGHWAHGDELARWYQAKENFWKLARGWIADHSFPPTTGYHKRPMTAQQRIDAAFARRPPVEDREPGEEG